MPLNNSERITLQLMTEGKSDRIIATERNLSLQTIRNQSSEIYRKLNVSNRVQAVMKAIKGEVK